MSSYTFNTATAGQKIAREMLIAYLNTGTSTTPVWSAIGAYVEDSSMDMEWNKETTKDILGITRTSLKKPIITQTFDNTPLVAGDLALEKIWDLAIFKQDAQALAHLDMMVAHWYMDSSGAPVKNFAERYDSSAIDVTNLGGSGGGDLTMPFEVTFGGTRTLGTISRAEDGTVTFTPDAA